MKTQTLSRKSQFRKLITAVAVLMLLSATSYGQQASTYKQTLNKMIEVSGSKATYTTIITQMVEMFKQQQPEVRTEVWTEFETALITTGVEDLVDMLLPVYQKHMTEADLKDIIAFYQSPAGKKLADKTPLITKDSMAAAQQWGAKIGAQLVEKLKEKGY